MLVNNLVLGPVEVPDEQIFNAPEGILAFDNIKKFALVTKQDDDVTLMWFQATDSDLPCFVVFNPFEIIDGYEPVLEASDMRFLECKKVSELDFLVIAVVPEDISDITVNLKSPIVINRKRGIVKQAILQNKEYPMKFRLVEEEQQAVNA